MGNIGYVRPGCLQEAIDQLNAPGIASRPLAGGTDLMVSLRKAEPLCDRFVDISRLPELKMIEWAPEAQDRLIRVGAAVTFNEAAASPLLRDAAPALVAACLSVGGPAVRNAGTIGGNVANAAACADTLPPLACYAAVAHILGLGQAREVPLSDLIQGANRAGLQPGELITHFTLTVPPTGTRGVFIKLGRRSAQAISRLSVAALGRTDSNGKVDYVRVSAGAAAPRATIVTAVEDLLLGHEPHDDLLCTAGKSVASWMVAVSGRRWSTEYKEPALAALAERALRQVLCNGASYAD